MRTEWPATRAEWVAAVLRFLVRLPLYRSYFTPETLARIHLGIARAQRLVHRADLGGAGASANDIAPLYDTLNAIRLSATGRALGRVPTEAWALQYQYGEIVGAGSGIVPLPPITDGHVGYSGVNFSGAQASYESEGSAE